MKSLFFCSVLFLLLGQTFASDVNPHLILVNGLAESSIDPNFALFQIEVWGKSSSAKEAQEAQAEQFSKLKTIFEKLKIKKEDYKTENYSVTPEFYYDQKTMKQKITSYRASHSVVVTFKKVDEVGKALDQIVTNKSDQTSGIQVFNVTWDSDKKAIVENSLVTEAVKNAKDKAEVLAKAASVKIKAVHRLSQNTLNAPVVRPMQEMAMVSKMMSDSAAPTELSGGQIKIRAEVQMEFEIEGK